MTSLLELARAADRSRKPPRWTFLQGFALGSIALVVSGVALYLVMDDTELRKVVLFVSLGGLVGGPVVLGSTRGSAPVWGWLAAVVGLTFIWAVVFLISMSRMSGMANMH